FEAVEQAIQTRPDGARFLRQGVGAFVRRAERARPALAGEVFAERLAGTPPRAFRDRVGELDLIRAKYLMHPASPSSTAPPSARRQWCARPSARILRLAAGPRTCSKTDVVRAA